MAISSLCLSGCTISQNLLTWHGLLRCKKPAAKPRARQHMELFSQIGHFLQKFLCEHRCIADDHFITGLKMLCRQIVGHQLVVLEQCRNIGAQNMSKRIFARRNSHSFWEYQNLIDFARGKGTSKMQISMRVKRNVSSPISNSKKCSLLCKATYNAQACDMTAFSSFVVCKPASTVARE